MSGAPSRAGIRAVPVLDLLRRYLREHQLALGRADGFVFGRSAERPFSYSGIYTRAKRVWKDAGLTSISLHECRHSALTLWEAAGVPRERRDLYFGHADWTVGARYVHVQDEQRAEDLARVNAHLARERAARLGRELGLTSSEVAE